jgi:hypothetical protein
MKEHLIVIGLTALAVTALLVLRDNMPKGNFSFKK